nr:MAG TPA: hypothetical protein [Caudoviricetes sp.]
MANEFDDYELSIEVQQALLERDQPPLSEDNKTTDEKISEMQNKMKIMDDSLTEIILDNLS